MLERSIRPRAYDNLPSERYQGRASFGQPPSKGKRKKWANETLFMIPTVLTGMGLSDRPDSTFFSSQLEQLKRDACPGYTLNPAKVRYGDTFTLTRQLLKTRPDYAGKVAVLNCASDTEVAGGWCFRNGTTQEDALCYSSTLWPSLNRWKWKYPWRSEVSLSENPGGCAGIFSPNVVVFRDELTKDCKILAKKDRVAVSVISVAALACPPVVATQITRFGVESRLKLSNDARTIRERFRMILRMAVHHKKSVLVLAALGCGVWKCPPKQMAEILKECLKEPEFEGWFQEICVGIYDEKVCESWGEEFGTGVS